MKKPVFEGSSAALVTPFRNGKVDFDVLDRLIAFQAESGTAALTVCGTTGEASTLTDGERYDIIKYAKEKAGAMRIIAGSGSNSTERAIGLSQLAEDAGADAALVVTPYYNKATQKGLIEHYAKIADSINIPVIAYNVPSRTGMTISAETYRTLSEHPNINGTKEASGNFGLFTETLRLCGDDLNIWSGNDDIVIPMLSLGAKGVISVAANIIPREMALLTGETQIKYSRLISLLFSEVNPIPVKAALHAMGLCENELRLPLTPMSGDKKEALIREMQNLGIIRS